MMVACLVRFTEYQAELVRQKKEQFRSIAVFPCKLRILPEHIFTRRDPITVGVKVEAGICRTGTPSVSPARSSSSSACVPASSITRRKLTAPGRERRSALR